MGVDGVTGLVTMGVSTSGDNRFMVARLWLLSMVLATGHLVDSNNFYKDNMSYVSVKVLNNTQQISRSSENIFHEPLVPRVVC